MTSCQAALKKRRRSRPARIMADTVVADVSMNITTIW